MEREELKGAKIPWALANLGLRDAIYIAYMNDQVSPVLAVSAQGQSYSVRPNIEQLGDGARHVEFDIYWHLGEWPDQAPK